MAPAFGHPTPFSADVATAAATRHLEDLRGQAAKDALAASARNRRLAAFLRSLARRLEPTGGAVDPSNAFRPTPTEVPA